MTRPPGRFVGIDVSPIDVLEFEAKWGPRFTGAKARAIRETFGVSALRFFWELERLLEDDTIAAAHPRIALRLRDQREKRAERRNPKPPIEKVVPAPRTQKTIPYPPIEKVVPRPEVERR